MTLEGELGNPVATIEADDRGLVRLPLLAPGRYRLLVEQPGFQPIRLTNLLAVAGRTTSFAVVLERKPPPIDRVVERVASPLQTGGDFGPDLADNELTLLDERTDFAGAFRSFGSLLQSSQGVIGFGVAAEGVAAARSRLVVDGVEELLVRHPGLPFAPASSPFSRTAVSQAAVVAQRSDVEWRPTIGSLLVGHTKRGRNRTQATAHGAFSPGAFGARTRDNPGDSATTSVRLGASIGGAIRPDTAHYFAAVDFQSVEEVSPDPWTRSTTSFGGNSVNINEALRGLGADSFGVDLGRRTRPPVRTWRGGTGLARIDIALKQGQQFTARAAAASWKERAPQVDQDLSGSPEVGLDGRDVSLAVALASTGATIANEARIGVATARREYRGAGAPYTSLIDDGVAFGDPGYAPARFDQRHLDLVEALQATLGVHRIKVGFGLRALRYEQEYAFGTVPMAWYGGLDDLASGRGAAFRVQGAAPVNFSVAEPAAFLQDVFAVSPEIDLLVGLRYEAQVYSKDLVRTNAEWTGLSGIVTGISPASKGGLSPRAELVWNLRGAGQTVVRFGAGLTYDRLDPATIAEVLTFDGRASVSRRVGVLPTWPNVTSGSSGTTAPSLTLLSDRVRSPRAFKASGSVTQLLGGGVKLVLSGHYAHTDFLLRRADLNLGPSSGKTGDGRSLYGALTKVGALVVATPGSNRRFSAFDRVAWLAPTGYADYYEFTTSLDRRLTRSWNAQVSYTYSRTRDNLLGSFSADPADQLSPFPEGLDGRAWEDGRSDFDVPHRATAMVEYASPGSAGFTLAVRGRYQSGLPFTPGYAPGVDINADGAANDPAFLAGGVSGLDALLRGADCIVTAGQMASRNSCRERAMASLDARFGLNLQFGSGGRPIRLTVDAFNLLARQTGIVDRALLAVDPTEPLVTTSTGAVAVPVRVNSRFGSLLARRGGIRWLRAGIQVGF